MVFLKGYQWPFDSSKVMSGSSIIDLLVYRQTALMGRQVYLDYRTNPFGLEEIDYQRLSEEAYTYLKKAGALFGTPIERLRLMNTPAIELYRSKGLELETEMLEIALCAQHNNGGIAVDLWWQTAIPGLFAVGECAGTHGISRPGGSALNAGQVGSLRAAQYLSQDGRLLAEEAAFRKIADTAIEQHRAFAEKVVQKPNNAKQKLTQIRRRMSVSGAAIREPAKMEQALSATKAELAEMNVGVGKKADLYCLSVPGCPFMSNSLLDCNARLW